MPTMVAASHMLLGSFKSKLNEIKNSVLQLHIQ